MVCLAAAACREDGHRRRGQELSFRGVKAVSGKQLKSVLATTQSAKLPWGEKFFFDRPQFEADIKRIVAFYDDRGYPRRAGARRSTRS